MQLNQPQFKNIYSNNPNFIKGRFYSTSTYSSPKEGISTPVLTITDLEDKDYIFSKREFLLRKGGIYSKKKKLMENNT